jgi:carboxyl-terminal processing protease
MERTIAFGAVIGLPSTRCGNRLAPRLCSTFLASDRYGIDRCSKQMKNPPLKLQAEMGLKTWREQACVVAVAAVAGIVVCAASPSIANALTEPQKLVAEAWRIVDQSFVDRSFNNHDWFKVRMKAVKRAYASVEDGYSAIRDMLALLDDPYTRFLTPNQYTSLTSTASGDVAGVGVEMLPSRVDGKLIIISAVENSPAERVGVRSNDAIILIDGEDIADLTPDEAAARIRGRPGTSVQLTLARDRGAGEEVIVYMRREALKLKSVKHEMLRPSVGYVKVKQFNSSTAEDMRSALEDLRAQKATRYVLDLRNNPGGYFPAGVDVARLFFRGSRPIVFVVDKNGIQDEIDSAGDGLIVREPLVVLVNKATASASEILAGALQDSGRAKLVGQQTFGKGVVQTVSPLSDGSGLAVTIARYETPAHKNINKVGITPDIKNDCAADAPPLMCLPDGFI